MNCIHLIYYFNSLYIKFTITSFVLYYIIFIYCIGAIKTFFKIANPSWIYYQNTIILDSTFAKFWKNFLFDQPFIIDFHSTIHYDKSEDGITNKELGNIFKNEWMAFNEMLFFVITSLLIFLCYRKSYSLMKIVAIAIMILIVIKYSLFIYFNRATTQLYSTAYYQVQDFGSLFINSIYNYSFYIIGVLFGLMNYTVQKGLIVNKEIPLNTN